MGSLDLPYLRFEVFGLPDCERQKNTKRSGKHVLLRSIPFQIILHCTLLLMWFTAFFLVQVIIVPCSSPEARIPIPKRPQRQPLKTWKFSKVRQGSLAYTTDLHYQVHFCVDTSTSVFSGLQSLTCVQQLDSISPF